MELRHAEMERQYDIGPARGADLVEMHHAEQAGEDGAGDDAEQHRNIGQKAGAPFDQGEDDAEHEQRDAQALQLAVAGIGIGVRNAVDDPGEHG